MNVLLVDHLPHRAARLRGVLGTVFWDVRLSTVSSLSEALQHARAAVAKIDLVVLYLDLPGYKGVEPLEQFRQELPWLRVLVISVNEYLYQASEALRAGAVGYLPSTMSVPATAAAIRLIGEAGVFIPPTKFLPSAALRAGMRSWRTWG